MNTYQKILTVFLVSIGLQLACALSTDTPGTPALSEDEQATLIAAQVETQLAAAEAEQSATEALELALAQTLTAIASETAEQPTGTELTPTPTETGTPTPTNTPQPQATIQPTNVPPTKTPEPTATPLPTNTPAPIVKTVIVKESDSDVNTGLSLNNGDHVSISASGEIWSGVALTGTNGPDGWDDTDCDPKFPLPCAHPFSLLYYIDGVYYEAGASFGFVYEGGDGKTLFLRINDDAPGNGSGSFSVTITITR